jgi:hypothetical protein
MGMEGNLYAVGNVILGGATNGTTTSNVVVDGTLGATSTTNAALVVRGGIGVAGASVMGGNLVLTSATVGSTGGNGALVVSSGGAFINGVSVMAGNLVLTSSTLGGTSTTGALLLPNGGLTVASASATTWLGGQVTLNIATEATTAGAGALVLSGSGATKAGIYVAGNIVAGGSTQPINAVGASGIALVSATATDTTITTTAIITGSIPNLTWTAEIAKSYYFEAYIMHDMTAVAGAKVFSVSSAGAGTLVYTVEQTVQQASGGSYYTVGIAGNASVAGTATTPSVSQLNLLARITGTFYNSSGATNKVFVQCQSVSGSSLVIRGSSFLKWTKLN